MKYISINYKHKEFNSLSHFNNYQCNNIFYIILKYLFFYFIFLLTEIIIF